MSAALPSLALQYWLSPETMHASIDFSLVATVCQSMSTVPASCQPESCKIIVCGNDYTLLPISCTAASDPDLRCTNPGCAQRMFQNNKPRKIYSTTLLRSIVATAFANREVAADLKEGPPISANFSILRGWGGRCKHSTSSYCQDGHLLIFS